MRANLVAALAAALLSPCTLAGTVIVEWNFNQGSTDPSVGGGQLAQLGGISWTLVAGSPSNSGGLGTNQALNTAAYAAQGVGSGQSGVLISASTAGFEQVTVSWEHRSSNTGSRFMQLEYSTDGIAFTSEGLAEKGLLEIANGDTWTPRAFDLSGIAAVAHNPRFSLRITAVFAPGTMAYVAARPGSTYSPSGTQRLDVIRISGVAVPSPGGAALMAFAATLSGSSRRRQHC